MSTALRFAFIFNIVNECSTSIILYEMILQEHICNSSLEK